MTRTTTPGRTPLRGPRLAWAAVLLLLGVAHAAGAGAQETSGAGGPVLVTRIDHAITPVIADHLQDVVDRADEEAYEAVVVEIDTPGGLDTAMRDIVQTFLDADVPVLAYVSPRGARAASAGALIAWSAHVVAMAPGTTIGAATPVSLEGAEVGDKIVNDAAAYARAVAEERGRNPDVAAEAVTEGRALSATEAVDENVADLVSDDLTTLLAEVDGGEVTLGNGATVTLRTAGAGIDEQELSLFRRMLQALADPNLAFLFMSLGTLGIIYELASPGIGVAGGLGVILIVLSLFGLSVLPIDAVGLLFLALAVALFVAELFAPGIGVAAVLGSASLLLAGLFLFREDAPGLTLSMAAVLPTVVVVGGAVVIAGRLALRSRHAPQTTGAGALVGRRITVARAAGQEGQALVDGAWWNLRADGPLEKGAKVRVRAVEGLDLLVGPDDPVDPDRPGGKEGDKEGT